MSPAGSSWRFLAPTRTIWLYLKQKNLSFRVLDDYADIEDAICKAWQLLLAETGRLKSLISYDWIIESVRTL
jgi:hypothetical protein